MKSSQVLEKGLQFDRRWMLLDHEGIFMTQRTHPELALFKLGIEKDHLIISHRGYFTKVLLNGPVIELPVQTRVFDDPVTVFEVNEEFSEWFSEKLKRKCKLVSFPENQPRAVDVQYQINAEQVSLADAYPYLIIGEESLADLNRRMEKPLPMNRFRPNLVFSGGSAFAEDAWRNFTIGKNRFAAVKPCARCAVPTVDQDTAEKGMEPTATLATYRREGNKVLFGQNVIAIDHGEIFEGDEIILE